MAVVKLSITPIQGYPGNYKVNVSGSGFVPNRRVHWRLKGEDPAIDDNIISPVAAALLVQMGHSPSKITLSAAT